MQSLMKNWLLDLISVFRFLFTPKYSPQLCLFSQNQSLIVSELDSVKPGLLAPAEKENFNNLLFF